MGAGASLALLQSGSTTCHPGAVCVHVWAYTANLKNRRAGDFTSKIGLFRIYIYIYGIAIRDLPMALPSLACLELQFSAVPE